MEKEFCLIEGPALLRLRHNKALDFSKAFCDHADVMEKEFEKLMGY